MTFFSRAVKKFDWLWLTKDNTVNAAALSTVIEEPCSGSSDEDNTRSTSRAHEIVAGNHQQVNPLQYGNQGGNGTSDNDSQPWSGITGVFKLTDQVLSRPSTQWRDRRLACGQLQTCCVGVTQSELSVKVESRQRNGASETGKRQRG